MRTLCNHPGRFTFPSDYKFHVPELSVLFDLKEDDVYKFCMRTRMEKSHIGELDWEKAAAAGLGSKPQTTTTVPVDIEDI